MFFFHYTPVRGISVSFFSIFFGAPPLSSAPALLALRHRRCFWHSVPPMPLALRPLSPPPVLLALRHRRRDETNAATGQAVGIDAIKVVAALYPYISCKKTEKGSGSLTKKHTLFYS